MSEIAKKLCKNCWYFDVTGYGKSHGECHRYPPSFAVSQNEDVYSREEFPTVTENMWCGEWADGFDVRARNETVA